MAIYTIPTRNDIFNYNFQLSLDQLIYTFKIHYNLRQDSWYLSINNLFINQRLTGGVNLLAAYRHIQTCPKGELRIIDNDGLNRSPTIGLFGGSILLQYITDVI